METPHLDHDGAPGARDSPRLAKRRDHVVGEEERVEPRDGVEGVVLVRQELEVADAEVGLRHAIAYPDRIDRLIIQNGDIYEDVLGPKYATIQAWWNNKTAENHRARVLDKVGVRNTAELVRFALRKGLLD